MPFNQVLDRLSTPFSSKPSVSIQTTPTGVRIVSDAAVNMIIAFEKMHKIGPDGLVYPYHDDVGFPTIGVGHLLSKVKWEPLEQYLPLSLEDAQYLLRKDLDKFASGVSRMVKVAINDNQFGALVSLAFNIGLGNLQASSLIRKLNRGDSIEEVAAEFLKWDKAAGKVLRGLTKRRKAESTMFLSGS